jgi:hypothetical protein
VGIIFSHHGLQHLLTKEGVEPFSQYVGKLATKLQAGGVFVSYPVRKMRDPEMEKKLQQTITHSLRGKGTFDVRVEYNTILIRRAQ